MASLLTILDAFFFRLQYFTKHQNKLSLELTHGDGFFFKINQEIDNSTLLYQTWGIINYKQ